MTRDQLAREIARMERLCAQNGIDLEEDSTMGLNVQVLKKQPFSDLATRHSDFGYLKNRTVPRTESRRWHRSYGESYDCHAIFIGKSGYGKSTTLNAICDAEIFESSPVAACTKTLQCVDFDIRGNGSDIFSLGDLPGVGESVIADQTYIEWYREFIAKSDCVVYVLRADQRDFAIDQQTIAAVLPDQKQNILIGLNFCDAVEPLSRARPFVPSQAQITNIERKCAEITRIFGIPRDQIIPYSATEKWQLDVLVQKIAARVKIAIGA